MIRHPDGGVSPQQILSPLLKGLIRIQVCGPHFTLIFRFIDYGP